MPLPSERPSLFSLAGRPPLRLLGGGGVRARTREVSAAACVENDRKTSMCLCVSACMPENGRSYENSNCVISS